MKWNNQAFYEYYGMGRDELIKLITCELYGPIPEIQTDAVETAGQDRTEIQSEANNRIIISEVEIVPAIHAPRTTNGLEANRRTGFCRPAR